MIILIILIVILVVSLIYPSWFSSFWNKITGNAVGVRPLLSCEETDKGDYPEVSGVATYTYIKSGYREKGFSREFKDYCSYGNTLIEYSCSLRGRVGSRLYRCENGCEDGACIS